MLISLNVQTEEVECTVSLVDVKYVWGYVKFTTAHCSSHIIEESILLQTVKDDLRSLIKDRLKIEKLYGIAEKKASFVSFNFEKEIKQIERQLKEVNKRFDNILTDAYRGAHYN